MFFVIRNYSFQNEIKNLEDAEAEILMFTDDTISVPILVGDCYVHYTQENATVGETNLLKIKPYRILIKRISRLSSTN